MRKGVVGGAHPQRLRFCGGVRRQHGLQRLALRDIVTAQERVAVDGGNVGLGPSHCHLVDPGALLDVTR